MPAEQTPSGPARSRVGFVPTPIGAAIIIAFAASYWLGETNVIAIGFFIALVIIGAADAVASRRELVRRPVSLRPIRSVAASPQRLRVHVRAPTGTYALRVKVAKLGLFDAATPEQTLAGDTESMTVELVDGVLIQTKHLRYRVSASAAGLLWARRWETQPTTMLHRAPGGEASDVGVTAAIDETGRLRTYVPGDRFSRVSWTVTARTGQLHVRAPGPGDDQVTVVINLGADPGAVVPGESLPPPGPGIAAPPLPVTQQVAQLAADVITALMRQGLEVLLVTTEVDPSYFDRQRDRALANPRRRPNLGVRLRDDGVACVDNVPIISDPVAAIITDPGELARRLAALSTGPDIVWPEGPHVEISPRGVTSAS